jgi:hypothetical protein
MKKTYVITHIISTVLSLTTILLFTLRLAYLTKYPNNETPLDFTIGTHYSIPLLLISIFTLEYFVNRYPKIQKNLTKTYFFLSLWCVFSIIIGLSSYYENNGYDLVDNPTGNLFYFYEIFLTYFLISFFIVSKVKVKSDEEEI